MAELIRRRFILDQLRKAIVSGDVKQITLGGEGYGDEIFAGVVPDIIPRLWRLPYTINQ